MTEQNRTEQNRTEQNRTEQNNNHNLLKKSSTSLSQKIIFILALALLAAGVIYLLYFYAPEVLSAIADDSIIKFNAKLAVSFLIMTALFLWLSTKKFWLRLLGLFVVLLPSAIAWYIGFRYRMTISTTLWGYILTTNQQEAANVFDRYAFLFLAGLCVFFVALTVIIGKLKVEMFPFAKGKARIVCNVCFAAFILLSFNVHFYPMRMYYWTIKYFCLTNTNVAGSIRDIMFLEQRETPWSLSAPMPDDGILVVHIGESTAAHCRTL